MKRSPSRVALVALTLVTALLTTELSAYQPASVPWKEFTAASELVAWVHLKKWEETESSNIYTFEVTKVYKGEKLETITLTLPRFSMEGFGPIDLASDGFIFLKKKKDGTWEPAMASRSWWLHEYHMKPDYNTVIAVRIGDFIHDFPPAFTALEKTFELVKMQFDNSEHKMKAGIYLRDDLDKYFDTCF